MKRHDLTGLRFTYLTVQGLHSTIKGKVKWNCICDCGNTCVVEASNLRSGNSKSCRCRNYENARKAQTKHGMRRTSEYNIWCMIKRRCLNKNNSGYKNYGGRGIQICDRWLNDFQNFIDDMGVKPSVNHSIDRFPNNDGNYEPTNCRWATKKQQANNTRSNTVLSCNGVSKTLTEWSEELKINRSTIMMRIKRGASVEKALFFR